MSPHTVPLSVVKATLAAALHLGLSKEQLLSAATRHPELSESDSTLLARLMPGTGGAGSATDDSFAAQVRAAMIRQLKEGYAGIESVAKALAVSPRTLQRRLESEGTTFGALVDETRRSAALEYLRNPDIAIKEAAFRVGFSEPSTFYRAFRRWTGATPADYRRSLAI